MLNRARVVDLISGAPGTSKSLADGLLAGAVYQRQDDDHDSGNNQPLQ